MKRLIIVVTALCFLGQTESLNAMSVNNVGRQQMIDIINDKITKLRFDAMQLDNDAIQAEKKPEGYRNAIKLRVEAKANRDEASSLEDQLKALGVQ